jgi:excisionase family DNA binding protein
MTDEQLLMTTREVAELFKVNQATVRNWCKAGRLTVFKTPGGQNRHSRQQVMAFYNYAYQDGGEE